MRSFHFRLSTCLWSVCVIGGLSVAPGASLCAPPPPAAGASSPLEGARQALDRAYQAKGLVELNGAVSKEFAANIGLDEISELIMASALSGVEADVSTSKALAHPITAQEAAARKASEKTFQGQAYALMNRYSLYDKSVTDAASQSGTLPPTLVARGHQFLTDVLVLSDVYEKSHPAIGHTNSLMAKDLFPAPTACDFHVLSPTQVKIVPRNAHKPPFRALLEDGQWRVDVGKSSPSAPNVKTTRPRSPHT